ncbi:DUF1402 family protein [Rhizobium lusitanum]|uniref:DUF1402 family protein n=1 Tax=Rhizobium lusitanum TaxID=293958 RepID=A0A6L9UFS9_9HYPH|nr:DUF1402 family protein [Rhizobium lusitanum]NEI74201.1 DUF1402 family protein [Rhizobium lusitanum]
MRRILIIALLAVASFSWIPAHADAATAVPPGNRNAEQPPVPGASVRRTRGTNSTFDRKYQKVRELLATDTRLMSKIKSTARAYGIDPIHIIGALVGEHTYNVDAYDGLQSYYVKAASYAGQSFRFAYDGENVDDFVARPQFDACKGKGDSYALWTCREDVWEDDFRGKTVGGKSYPDNRFSAVFFQPFYAGQTFGLGQVNPLTALELSDLVSRTSGIAKLDEKDAGGVYKAIMDPDLSLAFVAASIRKSIDDYRSIAGMDISGNPGITATLYNLGNSRKRAAALAARNRGASQPVWPEENYYGWLINDKLSDLKSLL